MSESFCPHGLPTRAACAQCGNFMLLAPPSAMPPTKALRTKTRIKVRSRFDRAGGAVDGEFIYDKETGTVTVREKGAKTSYSIKMSDLCEYIARRGMGMVRG